MGPMVNLDGRFAVVPAMAPPVSSLLDPPLRRPTSKGHGAFVRALYAAFSRLARTGEITEYVTKNFDPECEYWPVEEASPVRGHGGLIRWIERWLEAWDDTWEETEEILEIGEMVVVSTYVYGRGRVSGMEISQRLIDVFELRDGKVLRITEYLDPREALEAAGLSTAKLAAS
jgi:ketosteroid isomerase-like protein